MRPLDVVGFPLPHQRGQVASRKARAIGLRVVPDVVGRVPGPVSNSDGCRATNWWQWGHRMTSIFTATLFYRGRWSDISEIWW